MAKTFREWNVEQRWLPPSVMDFVPADHLAHFVRDTVRDELDLMEIVAPYEQEERGYPALPSSDDDGAATVCVLPRWVLLATHRQGVRRPGGLHGGDGG